MAAEPTWLDFARTRAETTPRCPPSPAVPLRALAGVGGAGPGGGALTPSRGTWPRQTPRRASPGGSSCCTDDESALHSDDPSASRHATRTPDRARVAGGSAHPGRGLPARQPSRPGLPAGVGRARPAGRSLLVHGSRLRDARARRRKRLRATAPRSGASRRRRPRGPAAVLRGRGGLPRLRRGLHVRAERAAPACARRRRPGARALPDRADRGRVRPRPPDPAGRRAARLRPGCGRALRRPAGPASRASSRCRR